jgi:hypothetical protein
MSLKDSRSHRDHHFERRLEAAKAGRHLPTEIELLRGMPFLSEDMAADLREFAERLSRRLKHNPKFESALLIATLDDLAVDQSQEAIQCVEAALDETRGFNNDVARAARLRIQFYLASCGDPAAAEIVAGEAASIALREVRKDNDGSLMSRALAWSVLANGCRHMSQDGFLSWPRGRVNRDLCSFVDDFDPLIARPSPKAKQQEGKKPAVQIFGHKEPISRERTKKSERAKGSVIVFSSIGNVGTGEGKRVSKEFEKVLNALLPLPEAPDLAKVRTRLIGEFPYAIAVIDELLQRLVGRDCIHFHPTILVGTPGCGKTRLARRLCEELGVPFELVSCGGMSDSALGGTPRRWSSGEPSIPVMAIRRHQSAGPVIILDEIEKVGTGRRNGNPHDVLIGLFEKETSERWFDPYVESPCVLSNVSWLMTANTLTGIPSVLLDRCRVIKFPEPGPEQLDVLAPRILEQLYVDAGYDLRWATPLDQIEIDAIASAWPGGSIRRLYRLVEKLVELREAMQPRQ